MAILSFLISALWHPLAFVDNLRRTINIFNGTYESFMVPRQGDGLPVKMRRPLDPEGPFLPFLPVLPYPGFKPGTKVLLKGHKKMPYNLPLPCDILLEQDFTIPMRDGVKLYCDIYRPSADSIPETKVPIIITWAPYGKNGNTEAFLDRLPERLGISRNKYSGYENFEAPDPAFWVDKGYSVVNIDARGSWNSEGNMSFWGNSDAEDGYDAVEFLAKLPWCNGKIGMAGNSWYAISQWFIASAQPPSLAAIAPWEGSSDGYRDTARRGGIPNAAMSNPVGLLCPGRGLQEDLAASTMANEFFDSFWEDKRAKVGKILCPAYVLASYSTKLHGSGSIRGWREMQGTEKWLRIHNEQEWADWLNYQDDLALFFDCFLKGIKNDWPSTPRVRLSLLRFSSTVPDVINRPLETYPPKSMTPVTYFLDNQTRTAIPGDVKSESQVSYSATKEGSEAIFDITFNQYTELAGFAKLCLWMECDEHDDMDVFALLGRVNKDGKVLYHVNFPLKGKAEKLPLTNVLQYQGPTGMLRASHREWKIEGPSYLEVVPLSSQDKPLTAPDSREWDGKKELWHPHFKSEKLSKGDVVKLEFTTWPLGMIFEEDETMRVRISGRDVCLVEATQLPNQPTENVGMHILHTGGKYNSHVTLPVLTQSAYQHNFP